MDKLEEIWANLLSSKGEGSASESLFAEAKGLVWTICRRVCRDDEEALDAFQGTWAQLLALARDGESNPEHSGGAKALIGRTALREADRLRKRRTRRQAREIAMDHAREESTGTKESFQDVVARRELREKLEVLVAQLPEKHRLPIQLQHFHGLPQEEIARVLGVPRGTVATNIARGLAKLRPMLKRAGLGEPAAVFAAIAGTAALLAPPASVKAATILSAAAIAAPAKASAAGIMKATAAPTILGFTPTAFVGVIAIVAVFFISVPVVYTSINRQPTQITASEVIAPPEETIHKTSEIVDAAPVEAQTAPDTSAAPANSDPTKYSALVQVVWKGTGLPVPDAQVVVTRGTKATAAKTDNLGEVELTFTPDAAFTGEVTITVAHPDAEEINPVKTKFAQGTSLVHRTELPKKTILWGKVIVKESGMPLGGAKVTLTDHGNPSAESDAQGRFEIAAGGLGDKPPFILATHPRYSQNLAKSDAGYKAVPGERIGPFLVELSEANVLEGTITEEETGNPVEAITIGALNAKNDPNSELTTKTDADGRYRITGLNNGESAVRIADPRYAMLRSTVRIEKEVTQYNIRLRKGYPVDVRARTADGEPLAGKPLSLQVVGEGRAHFIPTTVVTDEKGLAVLEGMDRNVPLGVSIHTCSAVPIVFAPGAERGSVDIICSSNLAADKGAGVFVGTVKDETGAPISNATVSIERHYHKNETVSVDERGNYKVSAPILDYRSLVAEADGFAPQRFYDLGEEPVTRKDFVLTSGRTIEVRLQNEDEEPIAQAFLILYIPSDDGRRVPYPGSLQNQLRSDADGLVILKDVPPGPLYLNAEAGGYEDLRVPLSDELLQTITMKRLSGFYGRVVAEADGEPVTEFTVRYRTADQNIGELKSIDFSNEDGVFRLAGLPLEQVLHLSINAPGYVWNDYQCAPGTTDEPQELKLSRGEEKKAILLDKETADPIPDAIVKLIAVPERGSYGHYTYNGLPPAHPTQEVVTGKDGVFTFRESSNAPLTIDIDVNGYGKLLISSNDRHRHSEVIDDYLVIRAVPGFEITGKVEMNGQPVNAASISINPVRHMQGFSGAEATTDNDGTFAARGLPKEGNWSVGASWTSGGRKTSLAANIDSKPMDGSSAFIHFKELGPGRLSGRVTLDGKPVQGVIVRPVGQLQIDGITFIFPEGTTDAAGNFQVTGLPNGEAKLLFGYTDNPTGKKYNAERTVLIGSTGPLEVELQAGPVITAGLVPPDGNDLIKHGDHFELRPARGGQGIHGAWRNKVITFHSDAPIHGEYELYMHNPYKRIAKGLKIDTTNGDQDLGQIPWPEFGSLRVRWKGEGIPTPTQMYIVLLGGVDRNDDHELESPNGEAVLEGLSAGTYFIKVHPALFKTISSSGDQVEIKAGEEVVWEAVVAPALIVAGMAKDVEEEEMIELKRARLVGLGVDRIAVYFDPEEAGDGVIPDSFLTDRGTFVFMNLSPGEYQVTLEAEGYEPLTRTVRAEQMSNEGMPPLYRMVPVE